MSAMSTRVVIVTGGTSGIGLECARQLGLEGARVVITGRQVPQGEAAQRQLLADGVDARFVAGDITVDSDWIRLMSVADALGRLDTLVNNAGTCTLRPFETLSTAVVEQMLATNFLGGALGLKYAIPRMRASGGGSVIAISSVAALRPAAGNSAYAGSKAALLGLHQALAEDLARGPAPIRLNVVFPGLIWGDGVVQKMGEAASRAFREAIVGSTPLGRVGTPEDIAEWVTWLASPASRNRWGNELVVDGGLVFGGPTG